MAYERLQLYVSHTHDPRPEVNNIIVELYPSLALLTAENFVRNTAPGTCLTGYS